MRPCTRDASERRRRDQPDLRLVRSTARRRPRHRRRPPLTPNSRSTVATPSPAATPTRGPPTSPPSPRPAGSPRPPARRWRGRPQVLRSARPTGPWAEIIAVDERYRQRDPQASPRRRPHLVARPRRLRGPQRKRGGRPRPAASAGRRDHRLHRARGPGRGRPAPRGARGRHRRPPTPTRTTSPRRRRSSSPCSRSSTSAARPDYQLRVACHDTAELDVLLRTLRKRCGAADTETTLILRSGPPLARIERRFRAGPRFSQARIGKFRVMRCNITEPS